ncbi:four-carbon acid sugar kinase family protein [Mucilaginibacter sp. RS28]|uniref:Four-carbon acid sugar kinase family protein n=1 Tax=Mucilaginibacter straminoryzae TaxID=2932774 RepID=A0A9X2BBP5_9SPHI|nr:four-carbon acid sugar kinase family protein [Mucilaginibacter straminoryzae]MCJ8208488.1 four-carbon acid sugar kinase family protein [Mucilaginibacter straminoryzae]
MGQQGFLLAYYGDDFTGSTDALEFLSRAGINTVLFLEPPGPEQLKRFNGLQAIGVAGMSRSMPPQEMEEVLTRDFTKLKDIGARHIHYKVCSTFDSSPAIGSIGKAIDVGASVFQNKIIPLLVAAPALGRYCLFGNLFARMGIGSTGQIYRLDRHPSMSKHPVTPADESDLPLHLARQTLKNIGLIDVLQLEQPVDEVNAAVNNLLKADNEIILFDGLEEKHLTKVGELMDRNAAADQPLFSVGSSGIEMALGSYWQQMQVIKDKPEWPAISATDCILVISGSCSPVTARQIETALDNGFEEVAIDTQALIGAVHPGNLVNFYADEACEAIQSGKSVVIHTSTGNDDERVAAALAALAGKGLTGHQISKETARLFGTALGQIAQKVLQQTTVKRLVIAGGDTSGYAARGLGIEAVEMIATVVPGAPLCRAYSTNKVVDGLEVNIKGGQVGDENYFLTVLKGNDYKP